MPCTPAGGSLRRCLLLALLVASDARRHERKLQSDVARELRRAEGKGGGKLGGGGGDAPAAAAPAAAAAAAPATAATGCCWLFNEQTKRYNFYPRPANAACQTPYKLAACPAPKPAAGAAAGTAAAAATSKPPPPPPPPPPSPVAALAAVPAAVAAPAPKEAVAAPAEEPPKGKKGKKQRGEPVEDAPAAPATNAGATAAASTAARAAAAPPKKSANGGGGGGGGGGGVLMPLLFLAAVGGAAFVFQEKIKAALADYFPDASKGGSGSGSGKATPKGRKQEYKTVGNRDRTRDDDAASTTSCGLPDTEVDAATAEWAARIAASRGGGGGGGGDGGGFGPPTTTALACGNGMGAAVPSFASPGGPQPGMVTPQPGGAPPPQEDFGGFGGFDDPEAGGGGGGGGWGAPPGQGPPVTPMVGQQGLGNPALGGFGGAPSTQQSDVDWSILGGASSAANDPWDNPQPPEAQGQEDDEEEGDFTIFDGFGRDNKPTNKAGGGGGGGGAQAAQSGLSWDDERKMWNQSSSGGWGGAFGGARRGGAFGSASKSSPWDLRSQMGTPASIKAFRAQAERVFNDNVSSSLFASPTMQRFKRQTDDLLGGLSNTMASITSYLPPVTGVSSYFKSWFG